MKNLLYIGNKLSAHGMNQTSIETTGKLLEQEGYKLVYASSKKNKMLRLCDMIGTTISCRNHVDYVLIDTYSTSNFWYAFIISQMCRILKLKYLPILHGGNLPNRLKSNPNLCSMIFNNAFKNVAPSNYLIDAFQKAGYSAPYFIQNPIELINYPFQLRESVAPKLLWVRSLASIYNPEMALFVLEKVAKAYPDATLCMVGPDKGNCLGQLKSIAKKLKLKVSFTGKIPKSEWIDLSKNYDIFMNTTHADNMPVSVVEAMALGMPVVSTNVGGIPFLIDDRKTGMLVGDSDADAMAAAIIELIEDSHLAQSIAKNARAMAVEFDWNVLRSKWHQILN